jgi:hypothetical protein
VGYDPRGLSYKAFNLPSHPDHKYIYGLGVGISNIKKFTSGRGGFFFLLEKVHILRITHFSETTKDRNFIFGMGGDANVKLCIQHFLYARGSAPPRWGICFKKCDLDPHPKPYSISTHTKYKVSIFCSFREMCNSQNMYFF